MMQIGDLQPKPPAFPNASPAEAAEQQQPTHRVPAEEQEALFVSPPPLPLAARLSGAIAGPLH